MDLNRLTSASSPRVINDLAASRLAREEPEFFPIWLADQYPGDPQIGRWCELEARQLEQGLATVARLLEYFPVRGQKVLDVGCQWGATCIALANAGAVVTGVDVREPFIRGARARSQHTLSPVAYHVAAAEELPFATGAFDVVLCQNVIEHVQCHTSTLKEIARVLAPHGMLYLDGPNRFSPHWLRRDPHYQMFGISVLPSAIGKFYVTRIRGFPAFDVGTFPVASSVASMLRRMGIEILASSHPEGTPGGGVRSGIAGWRSYTGRIASWLRWNTSPMFFFVGRRRSSPQDP